MPAAQQGRGSASADVLANSNNGTVLVPGTVLYADDTVVFWPAAHLAADTTFTVTLSTGITSAAGVPSKRPSRGPSPRRHAGPHGGEPAHRGRLRGAVEDRHLHGARLGHHGRHRREPGRRHVHHGVRPDGALIQCLRHLHPGDRPRLRGGLRAAHAFEPHHRCGRHGAGLHGRRQPRTRRDRAGHGGHQRDDPRRRCLRVGHRAAADERRDPHGQRHRRVHLPDCAEPHHRERRQHRARGQRPAEQHLLASGGQRHVRNHLAHGGRRAVSDVGQPADRRVHQRALAGSDRRGPRSGHGLRPD
ncbi:MAG: Ig-like domain-containing protein [Sandaracinaceae bacterium]|nr:Ig-like domain-containing protein [Sandaracinaceae bacterium]